eukprot:449951_1
MSVWVNKHYLYSNDFLPKPLILNDDMLQQMKIPKHVYIEFKFDERSEVRQHSQYIFRWLTQPEQIKLLNDNLFALNDSICNLKYIQLYTHWNIPRDDWKNVTKYGNRWHFGFERNNFLKPGLIYMIDASNDSMLHSYNHRVVTFKFNFTDFYIDGKNDSDVEFNEMDIILQIAFVKSYDRFGTALLWIDNQYDKYNLQNNTDFDCNYKLLKHNGAQVETINSRWNEMQSLTEIVEFKFRQPISINQVQYVHICVIKLGTVNDTYTNENKFKLLSLAAIQL